MAPTDPPPVDAEGDAPLRDDIRLLGRILGDVIREQSGPRVYELVEGTRKLAVDARRTRTHTAELAAHLDHLSDDDALGVIRASSLFSLLANIAEDVHQERRRRTTRACEGPGTLRFAVGRLHAAGLDADAVASLLGDLLVSPVLTAHPTEVRRKTVLDTQWEIAGLLARPDRPLMDDVECAEWERSLRRQVLTLWQTAMVRLSRLRVRDEINDALGYYERASGRQCLRDVRCGKATRLLFRSVWDL